MGQSESQPGTSAEGQQTLGLNVLRSQIDTIDRELVDRMNQRAELAQQIGHLKQSSGQQTYDPSREETVLERVTGSNKGPLSNDSLKAVYRELISGSRAIEQHLRVAHLGPAWTYSHLAALNLYQWPVSPLHLRRYMPAIPITVWCRLKIQPMEGLPTRSTIFLVCQ